MKNFIDLLKLFLKPTQIFSSLLSIALTYVFFVLYFVFVYEEEFFLYFRLNIPLLLYESSDYAYKFLLNNFFLKYMIAAIAVVLLANYIVNVFFELLIQIFRKQIED